MRRFENPDRISPPRTAAALDPALREIAGLPEELDDQLGERPTPRHRDAGELYGVHVPAAAEPEGGTGPDGGSYARAEDGEHWFEALQADSIEGGPVPERPLDPHDASDRGGGHHSTEAGDRPVADKGSGGDAGL